MAAGQDTAQQKMLEAEKNTHPHLVKHQCKPLCANTAYSCNKLWLFLYTLLYLFVGIGLLIIGVWAEVERRKYGSINNYMSLPVALLLSVGLIIFVNSILGITGTLQEHVILLKVPLHPAAFFRCFRIFVYPSIDPGIYENTKTPEEVRRMQWLKRCEKTYNNKDEDNSPTSFNKNKFLTITVVAFLVQVSIGVLAFVYRNQIQMSLSSSELKTSIIEYDSNASVQKSMDRLQTAWQCCGFDSYQDYEFNNLFKCSAKGERACGVPPSCCVTIEGHFPKLSCGYNVRRNMTMDSQASSYVYTQGCTPHLRSLLVLRLDIVGMVGLGSSIPQIIGFLLGYYFIRRVEEYHVWYRVGAIGSSMSTSS